jgi:hypothetical protein
LMLWLILSTILAPAYLVILNVSIHIFTWQWWCYRITIKNNTDNRIIVTAKMTTTNRRNLLLNTMAWQSSHIQIFYFLVMTGD